jgi:hypothetical protein
MGSKIIYDNLGALVLHMDIAPFEVLVAMSLVAVIRSKVAHFDNRTGRDCAQTTAQQENRSIPNLCMVITHKIILEKCILPPQPLKCTIKH